MEITLKIESAIHGHQTLTMPVSEAVDKVCQETEQHGKWLYCDGKYTNVDIATADGRTRLQETLQSAKDVVLAGGLLGG